MLLVVGLGLDTKDISVKALEAIKKADKIIIDTYTSTVSQEYLKFIESATGKSIRIASRSELEENAKSIIEEAKSATIALLVPGDPLIATTHHTILDEAVQEGVEFAVYHAPSIFSAAIGESGLDLYKFGPTTTIPFWSEKYKPTSFIEVIRKNIENKEHTLLLLDYNQKEGRSMDLETAIALLERADVERQSNIIRERTRILVLGNVGTSSQIIAYSTIKILKKHASKFAGKTLCIIVPGETNFAEEEALKKFTSSI